VIRSAFKTGFAILFFCTLSVNSFSCENQTSKQEIKDIVENIRLTYFPDLKQVDIGIREFKSDAYFLQAKPKITSLLKNKKKRQYFVEVNTGLYECSPSRIALEAIIAHELEHIVDYEKKNSIQIVALGASYASSKTRAAYERQTDVKVLYKGLAEGLIEYRKWIYQRLTPKQLVQKRKFYLTPEEIADFQY
jgi:hypothetical protein